MEPDMSRGDIAVVVPSGPGDLIVGDVIVFDAPEGNRGSIIHRVISLDSYAGPGVSVRTRGDNNGRDDPWSLAVVDDQDTSRRVAKVPFVGFLYLWLQSAAARVVVLFVGLAAAASFVGGVISERNTPDVA